MSSSSSVSGADVLEELPNTGNPQFRLEKTELSSLLVPNQVCERQPSSVLSGPSVSEIHGHLITALNSQDALRHVRPEKLILVKTLLDLLNEIIRSSEGTVETKKENKTRFKVDFSKYQPSLVTTSTSLKQLNPE